MTPDGKLSSEAIRGLLQKSCFVKRFEIHETLESTNLTLRNAAIDGSAGIGTCLATETQTAGMGRMGRKWQSQPHQSLTFSVLCPNYFPEKPGWMTVGCATSLAAALKNTHNIETGIKWPNDLYFDNRKLAGILAQAVHTPTGTAVVMGVGLNVNAAPESPLEGQEAPPISVREIMGEPADRSFLLAAILNALHETFNDFASRSTNPVLQALRQRSILIGTRARFKWMDEIHEGRVRDHSPDLAIVLEKEDSSIELPGETAELLDYQR